MEYCSRSARVYEVLWEANGHAPAAPLDRPDLPAGYREVFSNCIRHADPQVGSYLSNILVRSQVHDARLGDAVAQAANAHGQATDRYTLIAYLYRLGEIYALIGNLFAFARGEEAFHPRDLSWEDFRNAYGILDLEIDDIFIDDNMNLQCVHAEEAGARQRESRCLTWQSKRTVLQHAVTRLWPAGHFYVERPLRSEATVRCGSGHARHRLI